ncbi:MAG: hypothetical protein AAF493_21790 [Pseudomonadota bacterium]
MNRGFFVDKVFGPAEHQTVILDELIALIGSLILLIVEGVAAIVAALVNAILIVLEAIIGFFVNGFSLRRVKRYRRGEGNRTWPALVIVVLVSFVLVFGYDWFRYREITFVAEDGHSLPFASVVIHQGDEEHHDRTDASGHVYIPRFGVDAIELRSTRYVNKRWSREELSDTLVAERSAIAGGLEKVLKRVLTGLSKERATPSEDDADPRQ